MRYFIAVLSALIFMTWPRLSLAGGDAGNGGGVSEQYFVHAYFHLGDYIKVCLDSNVCRLTSRDRQMLATIRRTLPEEYKNEKQLQFLSGPTAREFFTIHGLVRVAVTGDHVGDPIFIYSDELYSANGKPITLGFAIGKLIHELGHHHAIKDTPDDWLDQLGEKVEFGYEHRALYDQTFFVHGSRVTALYFAADDDYRELIVSDEIKTVDLTDDLAGEVSYLCRRHYAIEYRHLFDSSPKFDVTNMRWRNQLYSGADSRYWLDAVQSESRSGAMPLTVTVNANCPTYPGHQERNWDITLWVTPTLGVNEIMVGADYLINSPFSHYERHLISADRPRE